MKKLFLLGAVAVLGLSACTKEHTCTCDWDGIEVKTTAETKKSVAKAYCEGEGYEVVKVTVDGEEVDLGDDEGDDDVSCTLD